VAKLAPRVRLIDLTRLASRVGLGAATGIDRVELAWASHLLSLSDPVFGLVRMKLGFALLDRQGINALLARVRGEVPLGAHDMIGRLIWRQSPHRARTEADLRRIAVTRAAPWGFTRMLRRLGKGFDYLNFGHANLSNGGLRAIKRAGGRITILIHDTIPLDYPQYTRTGITEVFGRKLAAVSAHADRIIHTTQDAKAKTERHLAAAGRVPPGVVANLGIELAQAGQPPEGVDLDTPFVLALGTIEPRKNLSLLAEVWSKDHDLPRLLIVGNRGWENPLVLDRLQSTPGISLLGALPDSAVAALMDRALALVFPSFAEGFGLPPLEAAARGLPVLCSDLPVLRELLGEFPVYLDPLDGYAWSQAIHALGKTGAGQSVYDRSAVNPVNVIPNWDDHFNRILTNDVDGWT
jgi:glycosyltransferase involved in cell wall biosynthesis